MARIDYLRGDATRPPSRGPKVVAHICNDQGRWGKGFVEALSRRWPGPEAAYRDWHRDRVDNDFGLGATQFVQVASDKWVANMVGQHGIRTVRSSAPPIRYEAVDRCLRDLAARAAELEATVHMPRIGCGLAGGSAAPDHFDAVERVVQSPVHRDGARSGTMSQSLGVVNQLINRLGPRPVATSARTGGGARAGRPRHAG